MSAAVDTSKRFSSELALFKLKPGVMHDSVLGLLTLQHVGCYSSVVCQLMVGMSDTGCSQSKEPFRQARNIGSVYAVVHPTQQHVMP